MSSIEEIIEQSKNNTYIMQSLQWLLAQNSESLQHLVDLKGGLSDTAVGDLIEQLDSDLSRAKNVEVRVVEELKTYLSVLKRINFSKSVYVTLLPETIQCKKRGDGYVITYKYSLYHNNNDGNNVPNFNGQIMYDCKDKSLIQANIARILNAITEDLYERLPSFTVFGRDKIGELFDNPYFDIEVPTKTLSHWFTVMEAANISMPKVINTALSDFIYHIDSKVKMGSGVNSNIGDFIGFLSNYEPSRIYTDEEGYVIEYMADNTVMNKPMELKTYVFLKTLGKELVRVNEDNQVFKRYKLLKQVSN